MRPRRGFRGRAVLAALLIGVLAAAALSGCVPVRDPLAVEGGLPGDPDSPLGLTALIGLPPEAKPDFVAVEGDEATLLTSYVVTNPDACANIVGRTPCDYDIQFSEVPRGVEVGSVVGMPATTSTPTGLLVRVLEIEGARVHAIEATLGDALEAGEFRVEEPLDISDALSMELAPGVSVDRASTVRRQARSAGFGFPLTMTHVEVAPGIFADGSVGIDVTCGAYGGLTWKRVAGVPIYPNGVYFDARCGATQTAALTITAEADANVEKSIPLGSFNLTPITFFIGPVPVVLVPQISFHLELGGKVVVGMTFGATEQMSAVGGITYNDGFSKVADFDFGFEGEAASGGGRLSAEAAIIGVQSMLLYGIVGPSINERLALSLDGKPMGQKPVWCLSALLDVGVSLDIDLGVKQLKWGPESIFSDSAELSCAGNQPPVLDVVSPPAAVFPGISGGGRPMFTARALDPEDGPLTISWSSDRDGALGTSKSGQSLYPDGLTLGTHVITLTTTDLDGASSSSSFTVAALDASPGLTFQAQNSSGVLAPMTSMTGAQGQSGYFRAVMTSPVGFVVGQCGQMTFTTALPVTDLGTGLCDFRIDFTTQGTFQVGATVTGPDGFQGTGSFAVTVSAPPSTVSPRLTPITASTMDGTPVPLGGVANWNDQIVMVVNSNSAQAAYPVSYAWEIRAITASGARSWTPLTGSGDSAVGSARVFTVPRDRAVIGYEVRVQWINPQTSAIAFGALSQTSFSVIVPPA